eukprot:gnl/TRDRNA2_/TRDRNA2_185177_c0_seq1.p1 gnl/TRDRNA2_/TRDRNA2_185177_c0~~gnl/TRDRNA2_/TRDRNA2_185177_c0_seq1.p1  ORF type:complete len:234 (+),score=48.22 gnl/TRDRNA2_/TRDRNA2_185177_c0_seq1:77-703(+)
MFALVAFVLLGIERFLYGYIYHFPESFKKNCDGPLKPLLTHGEGNYWEVAKLLGIFIKVFQFGVIIYDLCAVRSFMREPAPLFSYDLLLLGAALLGVGQTLNAAVFNAIGAIGVYYGNELGYKVPWCDAFPYNKGIPDPQYWGVVCTVWGAYLCIGPTRNIFSQYYIVAWYELFWYVCSMKLLEDHANGGAVLKAIGLTKQSGTKREK